MLLFRQVFFHMPGFIALAAITYLLSAPSLAQNYRWVDEDGRVYYGDSPPVGVEAQELQGECETDACRQEREAARKAAEERTNELRAQQAEADRLKLEEQRRQEELDAMRPQPTIQREVIVYPDYRRYYWDHPGRPAYPAYPARPGQPARPGRPARPGKPGRPARPAPTPLR